MEERRGEGNYVGVGFWRVDGKEWMVVREVNGGETMADDGLCKWTRGESVRLGLQ